MIQVGCLSLKFNFAIILSMSRELPLTGVITVRMLLLKLTGRILYANGTHVSAHKTYGESWKNGKQEERNEMIKQTHTCARVQSFYS